MRIRPETMSTAAATRNRFIGSLRTTMPTRNAPRAPMPVHIVYAVPSGSVFMETDSSPKLAIIATTVTMSEALTFLIAHFRCQQRMRHGVKCSSEGHARIVISLSRCGFAAGVLVVPSNKVVYQLPLLRPKRRVGLSEILWTAVLLLRGGLCWQCCSGNTPAVRNIRARLKPINWNCPFMSEVSKTGTVLALTVSDPECC